ncbi:MAG: hypothetical protein GF334_02470 [Candidatus Altiarchaeales archaeon]|nr:hypothetical protein [Candidatus Altiarchaeales archaeon]
MPIVKWTKLEQQQPVLGFKTKVRVVPLEGEKGKPKTCSLSGSASCREELNYFIRNRLGSLTYENVPKPQVPGKFVWGHDRKRVAEIDLDFEGTHQPDVTKMWINLPKYRRVYQRGRTRHHQFPQRASSYTKLIETTDALTGLVCLMLNPDRYYGNWWRTTIQDAKGTGEPGGMKCFVWYGTDNFFLAHPALTSIVFGLFRQSLRLVKAGQVDALSARAPRAEVRKALDQSDHERALHLVKKLKPLIASTSKMREYPIRAAHFDFLFDLHKAVYKHGFKEVFGTPSKAWNCRVEYGGLVNGSYTYFGASASSTAAKRIKELARK